MIFQKRLLLAIRKYNYLKKNEDKAEKTSSRIFHSNGGPTLFDKWKKESAAFFHKPMARTFFFYFARDSTYYIDREYMLLVFDTEKPQEEEYWTYITIGLREYIRKTT